MTALRYLSANKTKTRPFCKFPERLGIGVFIGIQGANRDHDEIRANSIEDTLNGQAPAILGTMVGKLEDTGAQILSAILHPLPSLTLHIGAQKHALPLVFYAQHNRDFVAHIERLRLGMGVVEITRMQHAHGHITHNHIRQVEWKRGTNALSSLIDQAMHRPTILLLLFRLQGHMSIWAEYDMADRSPIVVHKVHDEVRDAADVIRIRMGGNNEFECADTSMIEKVEDNPILPRWAVDDDRALAVWKE